MSLTSVPALGSLLASFFNDHLKLERGLRPNSITSYADAMRLLLQFAAVTGRKKITQLSLDDLGAEIVQTKLGNLLPAGHRSELQEQSHRIRITRYGIRPQSPFKLQVIIEERCEERTQRRYACQAHRMLSFLLFMAK